MKTITNILLVALAFTFTACDQPAEKINIREGIRSDDLSSNIVTRPVAYAFSALIGEGIEIDEAILMNNDSGFLELNINGHNRSYNTKRFRYKIEWLDANGLMIQTKTSTWLPASATGKSSFSLKAVAPRVEAVDFRMDTKKWE
ncbi:MAG TPA: YcfL family protein [Sedimentisphaerales bacterium]|nr:YcfL family protein [Sedimentisphaerales bacterium]